MKYAKITNGVAAAYEISRLKKDNPLTSFPKDYTDEFLATQSIYPFVNVQPAPTVDQVAEVGEILSIDGVWTQQYNIRAKTPEESEQYEQEMRASINAERDRRLSLTFAFDGNTFDCDEKSLARITGAATLAGFAVAAGAPVGFMTWHGGANNFEWIAADNTLVPMDAQKCFAFGQAAANNQSLYVFAAKALKNTTPIPLNYKDDVWWP
jgi:hypothetical protein